MAESNGEKKFIDPEKKPVTTADWITMLGGLLGAIKIMLAAPPFYIEIPQETFDALLNFIGIVFVIVAVIRNNRRYKNTGGYIATDYKTYPAGENGPEKF